MAISDLKPLISYFLLKTPTRCPSGSNGHQLRINRPCSDKFNRVKYFFAWWNQRVHTCSTMNSSCFPMLPDFSQLHPPCTASNWIYHIHMFKCLDPHQIWNSRLCWMDALLLSLKGTVMMAGIAGIILKWPHFLICVLWQHVWTILMHLQCIPNMNRQ